MSRFQSKKESAFEMRTLVKKAMQNQGASYDSIWQALNEAGIHAPNPASLKNKINRGRFSAVFFIQVLSVLNVNQVLIVNGKAHLVMP